jgi:hypothetical protein
MESAMTTSADAQAVLEWIKRETKDGGSLRRYVLPSYVRPKAILIADTAVQGVTEQGAAAVERYACTAGQSEWVELPIPLIESAEITGIQTETAYVHIFFVLGLKITGKVRCAAGCSLPDVNIDLRIQLPLRYSQIGLMFVAPFRIKVVLWLETILRGVRRVADLPEEVRTIVQAAIDPLLTIVRNSADLLCGAQLDMQGLQKRLQDEIDRMARPVDRMEA